jgi:HlyD family secretion protein
MTANIFVYTKEVDSALLIPAKALKFTPDPSLSKQFVLEQAPVESATGQHAKHSSVGGGGAGIRRTAGSGGGASASAPHDPSKDTAGQEVDTSRKTQHAFVWLKEGDTLVEKKIRIGLNDDTHVEVLKGLSVDDEVITGVEIPVKGVTTTPATRSPFMPARRGGGSTKPAGGKN